MTGRVRIAWWAAVLGLAALIGWWGALRPMADQSLAPEISGTLQPDSVAVYPAEIEYDPEADVGYAWFVYFREAHTFVCAVLDGQYGWASVLLLEDRVVWPREGFFVERDEHCELDLEPQPAGYRATWTGELVIDRTEEPGATVPPEIEVRPLPNRSASRETQGD